MAPSIYLINPRADFPSYHGAEIYDHLGLTSTTWIADLAITTVAAMLPDNFEVTLCDEYLNAVNLDSSADYIGLTGKSSQAGRMLELAQAFQQRGKVVIIGGPFASLSPEIVRPYCDILVRGEIEAIAPQLFADLQSGQWQTEYVGGQPDLRSSPTPRWDLYPNEYALTGCVQTSRGCPFECEFCDVIQYAGRKQRHKSVEQILAELDILYQHGYSGVFLADDNFTVFRRRSKELLVALRDWNHRQPDGGLRFSTQLSIDTAKEDEILQLCAEAGVHYVFIGIETPNEDSLRESKKRQNVGINLLDQLQRFLDHGIGIIGGMIVGFDSDGPDIFERQYRFAMATSIPIFTLGSLVAPQATPLYARMQKANRLLSGNDQNAYAAAAPWQTNIVPELMSRETLLTGIRWLGNRLYHPNAFGQRVLQFIESYNQSASAISNFRKARRKIDGETLEIVRDVRRLGSDEAKMFSEIMTATRSNPVTQWHVLQMMFQYRQIRYMYEQGHFWEPHLAEYSEPNFSDTSSPIALV
ncbi:MAG: radical SAM protein [Anaerolineae bacterium]|nr:radical SAM protein [Anaerolineae bacterium]